MVGGEGTRLRPLTYKTPKQMLKVAGVTMIDRVLYYLSKNSISRAVLSLGYKPDKFLQAYPDSKAYGVELIYAVEPEPLDTAGAIGFAARFADFNSNFVVVNGDVLTDLSITELVSFHEKSSAVATIALTPVDDPSRFGVVPTDETGKVTAFIEKPDAKTAPTNYINAGTYILENEVLKLIPNGRRVSIERETFPMLADRKELYALRTEDYWLDLGTPQSLIKANRDILSKNHNDDFLKSKYFKSDRGNWLTDAASIPPGVVNSLFGREFTLSSDTIIDLSSVGDFFRAGDRSQIINSIVGDGCKIESGVTVKNSILGDNVSVAEGVTVIDSIIGDDSSLKTGESYVEQRIPS